MADYTQPAQQTQLGTQARGQQPIWTAPELGLITRSSQIARPKNSAQVLKNLHWDGITWNTQNTGWTKHRAGAFNSGAAFKEMGVHYLASGNPIYLQQVGTKVQKYDPLSDPGTAVETDLFTATSETVPCFRSYNPALMIYTNGVDNPKKYDGTTWAALSGWPVTNGSDVYAKPKLSESFIGRQIFAGFENYPFAVLISEFGNPEGWTFTGSTPGRAGIINVPSKLGPITAIRAHTVSTSSNEEIVVIGCKRGLVILTGSTPDDFQRIVLTDKFGLINNRCFVKIDDTLFTLATDGIRPLAANQNISRLVSAAASYPVHSSITAMATGSAAVSQPFVIDNPSRLEAVWYFPQGSDTHNRFALVMNYSDLASGVIRWSTKEYPRETVSSSSWYSPACGLLYEGRYLCGGYNGILQVHYNGRFFDTVPIQWQYKSPILEAPTPAQAASINGFMLEFEGLDQDFTAKCGFYEQTATEKSRFTSQFTERFQPESGTGTVLGSWVLGEGVLPGPLRRQYPFYPGGAGRAAELDVSGDTTIADCNFVGAFATLIGGGTRQ